MIMQTAQPTTAAPVPWAHAASAERLARTADALRSRGIPTELLDDAASARRRVRELIPTGATVLAAASETLRLSGIQDDIDASRRYESIRARVGALSRATEGEAIRRLYATPDYAVGSVSAVTETGSLVAVSASGSQLPAYAGGAGRLILVVGAQKVVPDLATALRRVEEYCLPLEDIRARRIYGQASAINKVLVIHREPLGPRTTVLLLRQAIGY